MARLPGLEGNRASWGARIVYWFAKRNLGHVPSGMKILAYYPRLLRQHVRMNMLMQRKGELPSKLKRLAMLKTAMLIGCPF